jgi:hypothetical protein
MESTDAGITSLENYNFVFETKKETNFENQFLRNLEVVKDGHYA